MGEIFEGEGWEIDWQFGYTYCINLIILMGKVFEYRLAAIKINVKASIILWINYTV